MTETTDVTAGIVDGTFKDVGPDAGMPAALMRNLAFNLATVRVAIKRLQDEGLAPLMVRQAELQDALHQQMAEAGVKTLDAAGLQFQRRITTALEITNDAEFIAALSEAGMLDDCLRLDKTVAKKAAKGREMPGTAMVERETFAVMTPKAVS